MVIGIVSSLKCDLFTVWSKSGIDSFIFGLDFLEIIVIRLMQLSGRILIVIYLLRGP